VSKSRGIDHLGGKANRDGEVIKGRGDFEMETPRTTEQLAAYMLIVNPVVCPRCLVRYPPGTKTCGVCGKELPLEDGG